MNAMEILVIILSIFLAIFLLIATVLALLLIRVTLQIRRVTVKAEQAASTMENFMKNATNVASKAFLGKMIVKAVKSASSKRKGGTK